MCRYITELITLESLGGQRRKATATAGLEDYAAVVEHFQLFSPFLQFVPSRNSAAQSANLEYLLQQITQSDFRSSADQASVRCALNPIRLNTCASILANLRLSINILVRLLVDISCAVEA